MRCTNQDSTARALDHYASATAEPSPDGGEAPRRQLTAVPAPPAPAPVVGRESADRSNRVFNWLVGMGLAILVLCLAAVMLNAGINVAVLP